MLYLDGKPVAKKFFPDGTLNLTDMGDLIPDEDAYTLPHYTIEWLWEDIAEQVILYNLVYHLRDHCNAATIDLIMPYIPNARMDRTKDPRHEVHTLKYFTQFINDLGFNRVYVLDAHSDVSLTLIDRVVQFPVEDIVKSLINEINPDYIFFPDAGAMKRYNSLIIRTPFYGEKNRDWKTGKILGLEIHNPYHIPEEDYQGKSILIIDDICSRGGTFFHAATALKECGFGDISLYITHCENSIFSGEVLKDNGLISKVYTTNSLSHGEHEKLHTIELEFTSE